MLRRETLLDIGEKLRQLRLQRGLTQEDMADRCERSKGFISQVERNLASPSIATLTDMLECLGSSLSQFFSEAKDEKTIFSQKNAMEPILVELDEGGQTYPLPPHEGEEFGYVLSGAVYLVTGDKKARVRTGCSFCIHPRQSHYLINAGKTKAKVLWVSNPPVF